MIFGLLNKSNSDLINKIIPFAPANESIYLVGGALRDALSNRPTQDLDFVVETSALGIAQKISKSLNIPFFTLDSDRDTVRLITSDKSGVRILLDFAKQRGPTIEEDLKLRDFTINAIAVDLSNPQSIIDPLGGIQDLKNSTLRSCSENSFKDDPIRIMRAVRHALTLHLQISTETKKYLLMALPLLSTISPERIRDELFKMLEGSKPASALRSLDVLGVLKIILPEIEKLKEFSRPSYRNQDAWSYTLHILTNLETVLHNLIPTDNVESSPNLWSGLMKVKLGKFSPSLKNHLELHLNPERSQRSLLFFSGLYNVQGEKFYKKNENNKLIPLHQNVYEASIQAASRARKLHLNNTEIERIRLIVLNQSEPQHLINRKVLPNVLDLYKYFRHLGSAGIDACLLSMSKTLALNGTALPIESWNFHLDIVSKIFEAYWTYYDEIIDQKPFLSGDVLISEFGLQPGPELGILLELLKENQVSGEIKNQADARLFIQRWLSKKN